MPDISPEKRDEVLSILSTDINYEAMINTSGHPGFGQFVVTGMSFQPLIQRVGYCVQVRRGVGQFGSDMVFLRHADGSLCQHENNCYIALSPEEELLARKIFICLPEDESEDKTYGDVNGIRETGFIIECSVSKGAPDVPFGIAIISAGDHA